MDASAPDPSGNFTLEVENFGPIARASVELRPLTVFAGPSNTGKSYLAILAYALHNCFARNRFPNYGLYRGYPVFSSEGSETRIADLASAGLQGWLRDIREWLFEDEGPPPVPPRLSEGIRPLLENADDLNGEIVKQLTRCFGVERHGELIRRVGRQQTARIAVSIPRRAEETSVPVSDARAEAVNYQFDFSHRRSAAASGRISVNQPIHIRPEYLLELREMLPLVGWNVHRTSAWARIPQQERSHLLGQIMDSLLRSVFHPLNANAFYLPASRTGVMHSHQTVVSALIQNATAAGRRPTASVPVLSGVLADFLDELLTLNRDPWRGALLFSPRASAEAAGERERFDKLARLLEENMLEGGIDVEAGEVQYPTFSYRPTGWEDELPLMRTSSMVSELAPIVLYLRYLVRPGDLFIIEEPESHLHPAMQAVFARELARLVHSGVRVLLTTHSEWFLEQIGNLVRLSDLPEDKRSEIPGADVALRSEQVGAWLFTPKLRPRGSVVEEIGLEEETGLYPAGYDEVSEALYNESAEIFNRLQEATGE